VAWPEPLLPVESDGESALLLFVLLLDDEPVDVVVEVLLLAWSAACAAMPTPRAPARLATISAPVIAVVRLRPWSRSMSPPLS
jgi:hypothetical protein